MRITSSQAVARPNYIDRNPIQRLQSATVLATGPHTTTQRYSYTVPAGKRAIVEFIEQHIRRDTAAAPVGIVQVFHQYTPFGGSLSNFSITALATNGALDNISQNFSVGKGMAAGDVISGSTNDVGTGGTLTYVLGMAIVEFDA